MTTKVTKRRFVRLQDGSRVLVRWFRGKPGFEVRWTDACNGCSEYVDGYLVYGPSVGSFEALLKSIACGDKMPRYPVRMRWSEADIHPDDERAVVVAIDDDRTPDWEPPITENQIAARRKELWGEGYAWGGGYARSH